MSANFSTIDLFAIIVSKYFIWKASVLEITVFYECNYWVIFL